MEYIALIKRFWEFNEKQALGHTATALYLLLLNIWDKHNCTDFSLSDKKVGKILKLSRPTVKTAKDSLRNLGLLNYKNISGFPCVYKIITNYEFSSNNSDPLEKSLGAEPKEILPQKPKIKQSTIPVVLPENIPSVEEFLEYAKTLEIYDKNSPNLDFLIKTKYESWVENGWNNLNNRPITNWKTSLKSSLPYMLKPTTSSRFSGAFTGKAPIIKRPKQTYNE